MTARPPTGRGAGATLIRFTLRDGELAIAQEGRDEPRFTRIAVRHIADGGYR